MISVAGGKSKDSVLGSIERNIKMIRNLSGKGRNSFGFGIILGVEEKKYWHTCGNGIGLEETEKKP